MERVRTNTLIVCAVFASALAAGVLPAAGAKERPKKPPSVEWNRGELKINGQALKLPCGLGVLAATLGQPDRTAKGAYGPVPIWDGLGIVSHLNDDGTVKDIGFRLGKSPYGDDGEFKAKSLFTGDLVVDGVKFDGAVTFEEFWAQRKGPAKKLLGGESVLYDNGTALYLSCEKPAKGAIWNLAVGVRKG